MSLPKVLIVTNPDGSLMIASETPLDVAHLRLKPDLIQSFEPNLVVAPHTPANPLDIALVFQGYRSVRPEQGWPAHINWLWSQIPLLDDEGEVIGEDEIEPCAICGHNSYMHSREASAPEDAPFPCRVMNCHCEDFTG